MNPGELHTHRPSGDLRPGLVPQVQTDRHGKFIDWTPGGMIELELYEVGLIVSVIPTSSPRRQVAFVLTPTAMGWDDAREWERG